MELNRIQSEFAEAQKSFANLEFYPTTDGKAYVKVLFKAGTEAKYVLSIKFPEAYPNEMPKVFIDAPFLDVNAPHRYQNGNICFLHPSMWNPGVHNLKFVIARTAKWLNKYEIWKHEGYWPGAQMIH